MIKSLSASTSILLFVLSVMAQPRKNVEFNYYERNPVLFLLLLGAAVLLVVILAVIFFKRRK